MSNNYQNKRVLTSAVPRDAMPETVSVAMAEIAEDVTAECGPKGKHDAARTVIRHGHEAGSVTLGGRTGHTRTDR